MGIIGSMLVSCVMGAAGAAVSAEPVNLGRLAIASVVTFDPDGARGLEDRYYGPANAFDGGINIISGINYSTWTRAKAENEHSVSVRFEKPVAVSHVVIAMADENYKANARVQLIKNGNEVTRILAESRKLVNSAMSFVYVPEQAVGDVDEVRIAFLDPAMIKVQEIHVMGTPPGGVDLTPVKPKIVLPADDPRNPPYEIKTNRTIRNETELRIIKAAELCYPPREDVVKAWERAAAPSDDKLWWWGTFDDVRLPYAITSDAIDYYQTLIKSYEDKSNKGFFYPVAHFGYDAKADFHTSVHVQGKLYSDVYVVKMNLRFSAWAGPEAAVRFAKERTVVMDREGKVLKVHGDEKGGVLVS